MMRVFHCDMTNLESMPIRHADEFVGIIIRHEKITGNFSCGCEKHLMVEGMMGIEPIASTLSSSGIGRVDKERRSFLA